MRKIAEQKEIVCRACGKTFKKKQDHGRWPIFCSRECFCAGKHPLLEKRCESCGDIFIAKWKGNAYAKYCGNKCRYEGMKTGGQIECYGCGKLHYRTKSREDRARHSYCNIACRKKHMKDDAVGGSYKGGVTRNSQGGYWMIAGERVPCNNKGHKTKRKYTAEYRLIAGEALGRKLKSAEFVWHLNRDRDDNRLSNLYVFDSNSSMATAIQNDMLPEASNLPQS